MLLDKCTIAGAAKRHRKNIFSNLGNELNYLDKDVEGHVSGNDAP